MIMDPRDRLLEIDLVQFYHVGGISGKATMTDIIKTIMTYYNIEPISIIEYWTDPDDYRITVNNDDEITRKFYELIENNADDRCLMRFAEDHDVVVVTLTEGYELAFAVGRVKEE
jgi:hypothetical protein